MRRFSAALGAFILSASFAHAQWSVVSSESEFTGDRLIEHRRVVVRSDAGAQATLDLAIFSSKKATLRAIDDPGASSSLAATMQRENCLAGVNGGYFDPEYAPVGLLVSGGRTVTPYAKARLLSGVVSVVNGRVLIQRAAEFSMKSKPKEARQCGPFLVDRGKPNPGLNATRSARRTFVATGAGDRAAIGFCSYLTLGQTADLLGSPGIAGDFQIQRALNLDGGSSSGFWFAGEKGVFSLREQKTVRDYLAVVPK